jgi:hypothetical protein
MVQTAGAVVGAVVRRIGHHGQRAHITRDNDHLNATKCD